MLWRNARSGWICPPVVNTSFMSEVYAGALNSCWAAMYCLNEIQWRPVQAARSTSKMGKD